MSAMCKREENEPLMRYWFRQYIEDPFKVLSFCAFVVLWFVYSEAQEKQDQNFQRLQEQSEASMERMERRNDVLVARIEAETKAMMSVVNRLDLIDAELKHLEHRVDARNENK